MAGIWDDVAYLTRYGKQPLSEVLALTRSDAGRYMDALSRIVGRENPDPKGGGGG